MQQELATPPTLEGDIRDQFADFFDQDALRVPPYRLYRWTYGNGQRTYFRISEAGYITFYPGYTGLDKATTPIGFGLLKYYADNGMDAAREYMNERSDYGTLMHIGCAMLLLGQPVDIDAMRVDPNISRLWQPHFREELQCDFLAFADFIQTHEVRPLLIEGMMTNDAMGFACTVDLVCRMKVGGGQNGAIRKEDYKKGLVREVVAVVDFKSGKKGFYPSHQRQAEACRITYNASGIGPLAEASFNWAPKGWHGEKPTWTLKEQTDEATCAVVGLCAQIWHLQNDRTPKPVRLYDSVITPEGDLTQQFRDIPVEQLIRQKYGLPQASAVAVDAEVTHA